MSTYVVKQITQKDAEDTLRKIKAYFTQLMASQTNREDIVNSTELSEAEKRQQLNIVRKNARRMGTGVAEDLNKMLDAVSDQNLKAALES